MAEVVLFHHVQGLTDGLRAFAGEIRADGHTVHTPDLFNGELPASIEEGIAFTDSIDSDELETRIRDAVADEFPAKKSPLPGSKLFWCRICGDLL